MGSYSSTKLDNLEIWWNKSEVDEDSLSIFLECDRRRRPDPGDDAADYAPEYAFMAEIFEYAVPAARMRERLDALGFTYLRARADYDECLEIERSVVEETGEVDPATIERLNSATFEAWQKALASMIKRKIPLWSTERLADYPEGEILRVYDDMGVLSSFSDRRLFLRAMLESVPKANEVVLDITELVHGGYYEPDEPICAIAREHWSQTHAVYGSTVVLTEGRSDSRILSKAFQTMSPHISELFGFLDFEGLRIEGSAETLAKTIRAFVGARLSARVIAIFDNDTAGAEAVASLSDVTLPPNIRVLSLPHNELACAYPTSGPQGLIEMDVNGLAASIELYLGAEALISNDRHYHPVRWTGWRHKLQRYQGSVECKDEIQAKFLALLDETRDPSRSRKRFPELAKVVDEIAFAFAKD